jgi:hypothetical protein
MALDGKGGSIKAPNLRMEQMLAQMSNYYDAYPISVSGIAAEYLVSGYVDVFGLWKPGEMVYQFHNAGAAEATIIHQNNAGTDVTLKLAQNQFSGKLANIRYIKVAGTSDSLVVYTQKYV